MSRIDDILAGKTDLPTWKVERYRELAGQKQEKHVATPMVNPPMSEPEAFERFPCIYRTPTSEVHVCKPCFGRREHTVCRCSRFDQDCTVRAAGAPNRFRTCLACDDRDSGEKSTSPKWIVGVTTAPRKDPKFDECLQSLVANGWTPIIFAEPGSDVRPAEALGLRIVQREVRLGCWHNWREMCQQLVEEYPDADAILTVQDDTVFHPETRAFIESKGIWPIEAPDKVGFFTLYMAKHYQYKYRVERVDGTLVGIYDGFTKAENLVKLAKENEHKGWPARRKVDIPLPAGPHRIKTSAFWGSCALVFRPATLGRIITHRIAREWRGAHGNRTGAEIKNSDTALSRICKALELEMWGWNPSFTRHAARYSSIGHGDNSGRRNAHRVTKDPWKDAEPRQLMGWTSLADMDKACAELARIVPADVSAVAGLPRSGVMAAYLVANHLHVPLIPIESCMGQSVKPFRPGKSRELIERKGKVLIVDDSVSSGKSLKELKGKIRLPHYIAAPLAAVRGRKQVQFFTRVVAQPQVFQWNWLAANYTESFLFDMDGVIVEDWTGGHWKKNREAYDRHLVHGKPLYLPRRKILAVVTGRSELVRQQTEEWLTKHGVQYGELIMRPDGDRREHAEFKADVYQRIPTACCFAESSEKQAAAIAKATGRSVLSVETWTMHNIGMVPE